MKWCDLKVNAVGHDFKLEQHPNFCSSVYYPKHSMPSVVSCDMRIKLNVGGLNVAGPVLNAEYNPVTRFAVRPTLKPKRPVHLAITKHQH